MLKAKDMPKRFWGEVASIIVYIQNRCPTKKIVNMPHYGAWTSVKSNVNIIRMFGSMCFRHVRE